MESKRWMTIFFTDGTNLKFDFPKQLDDYSQLGMMLKKLMDENQLVLEVEGTLFMIPLVNVKYIQAYPCPDNLPDTTIRGANLVD
ncbi:hypothetical protein ACFLZL_01545 [Thermodesulfobacteriota bacterium]